MFLSLFFIDKFYEKNVMKTYSKCEIQSNIKYVWVFVYNKNIFNINNNNNNP
jgi:hypothetical protein